MIPTDEGYVRLYRDWGGWWRMYDAGPMGYTYYASYGGGGCGYEVDGW